MSSAGSHSSSEPVGGVSKKGQDLFLVFLLCLGLNRNAGCPGLVSDLFNKWHIEAVLYR